MANTLPAPTEGLVYTNPTTGKRMKFSDGCWKPIDYLPLDGSDSMQGTLWTPDQLINGNTLTADDPVGAFATGDDDIDWENGWVQYPSAGESNVWTAVAYGDGKFVAVSTGDHGVMYSTDAINWTGAAAPSSNYWKSVTYGNGKWVSVSNNGYGDRVMYSEDAINWTGATSSDEWQSWCSVTYGAGKFVAVANNATNRVMYSEDGINWTGVPSANESNSWFSVIYSEEKGIFVAVALGGDTNRVMYSEDGINWTGVPSANDSNNWRSVTYGNGKFVAVAYTGSNRVMYSEDGINWTGATSSDESNKWYSVTYGAGKFVAVSYDGNNRVMYSEDGVNWTGVTSGGESASWDAVTYGNGKFVAVAAKGTNRVMVLDAPEGSAAQDLYFNGDPVVIDTGLQGSLATLLSTQSTKLGRTKYYQDSALPTGDSYDYPDGSLWYQPSSNNLHFYNDSDQTWVQL